MRRKLEAIVSPFHPALLLRHDFPKKESTAKVTLTCMDDTEEPSFRFGIVVVPLTEKYVQDVLLHLSRQSKVQFLQAFLILLSIHGTTRSMSRGEVSNGPGPISPLHVQL
jgi:hypothetical protein